MTEDRPRRGVLRVYLGSAPGVGKTFAMLDEGHRRRSRGTDVVAAYVETHGRRRTADLVEGLEVIPRQRLTYRGAPFTELDVDAVLRRAPRVALVDELAHTNVPGTRNAKRWQDVEELLEAGIDVITTVNIQHLESLNDVVEAITGVRQQETVPDQVVRRADQIELVDMSPQALRRRLAHGNVYAAEKIDAALANYFRVGNLTALRELALLWTADRVDDALERYRAEHEISAPWPARERVVVAVTGGPESESLIRRGARITERATGGELLVVHVIRSDGLTGAAPDALARQRRLAESLDGSWHTVVGDDIAEAILEYARGVNASQLVLGASRRSRLSSALSPGVGPAVVRDSGDIDVYIVTHSRAARGARERSGRTVLGRRRLALGWVLAAAGLAGITLGLSLGMGWPHTERSLATVLMLFLALTVGVARVGGLWPALVTALAGGLLGNYFFTPPLYTWTIADPFNAVGLVILVGVAIAVSTVVDLAARRTAEAARSRSEADLLSTLAGSVLRGADALPALLDQLCESFGLAGATLFEQEATDGRWTSAGSAGPEAPRSPDQADTRLPIREDLVLGLTGHALPAEHLRVVNTVGIQAEAVLERDRLRSEARAAQEERDRTRIRTALLAAVSHDLRTPLSTIRAGVSALLARDVALSARDQSALLQDVHASAERLQGLIDNLLDMSRLDADAVRPVLDKVAVDEPLLAGLAGLSTDRIDVDLPDDLPLVVADPGLLERVIGNVAENAVKYAPPPTRVLVTAGQVGTHVVIRVVDRGPGVPDERKADLFRAFQRLGDAPTGHGSGLGLAVARGLAEAGGATLEAEDTPGGGLTMVLTLPTAGGDR